PARPLPGDGEVSRSSIVPAARLGAAGLLLGACVSTTDIEGLHRHIGDVEKKVDVVSAQSSSKEEVARLNENLTKQVATLLRANADVGAKFDEMIREMQTLAGKLE